MTNGVNNTSDNPNNAHHTQLHTPFNHNNETQTIQQRLSHAPDDDIYIGNEQTHTTIDM